VSVVWGRARKKPVEVDFREVRGAREIVRTKNGEVLARKGFDYVIRGVDGELYPIDRDIFDKTYEVTKPLICSLCGHPKGTPRENYGNCNCSCHRGD
jgi:hypothetical protein